jgi:hypothetical protein
MIGIEIAWIKRRSRAVVQHEQHVAYTLAPASAGASVRFRRVR